MICGIGAIIRMGGKPLEESQVNSLLLGLEVRGKEASGVLLQDKNSSDFKLLKNGESATSFINSSNYKNFIKENLTPKTRLVLVHTRMPTLGTPRDNSNNHPLFDSPDGNCAVVHNGMVSNHMEQFTKMGLAKRATVDSDIIRAICDKEGLERKTVRELSKLSGSIAAAVIDKRKPNSLLLLRSGNPICMAVNPDLIIFASLQKVVATASKTWVKWHGIWGRKSARDLHYSIFPADSAWFIGPQGLEWHQEFKTAAYTYNPSYSRHWHDHDFESYGYYGSEGYCGVPRMLPLLGEAHLEKRLICPTCKSRLTIPDDLKAKDKSELFCRSKDSKGEECNTNLKDATEVYVDKGAN